MWLQNTGCLSCQLFGNDRYNIDVNIRTNPNVVYTWNMSKIWDVKWELCWNYVNCHNLKNNDEIYIFWIYSFRLLGLGDMPLNSKL